MIISIILAILSALVIIFTIVYLRKNGKKEVKYQKIKSKKSLKKLWEIDDIKEKIIISGNKNTIIMRIGSIDYNLLSDKEQNVLESSLIEIAKTIKYPIQFFSTTEFIDTTEIINEIEKSILEKDNIKIIQYGNEIINYLAKLMENRNLFVRKNYVVITCYGNYDKSKDELINLYEGLRFNLSNAKISLEILDDFEIIELLHRELNKNTTIRLKDILEKGGTDLYVRGIDKLKKNEKIQKRQKEKQKFI